MKKKIWGHEKAFTFLGLLGKQSLQGENRTRARRRRIIKLHLKESRPADGYKTYTIRRSKPYHMWNSIEVQEESKHYWKEDD